MKELYFVSGPGCLFISIKDRGATTSVNCRELSAWDLGEGRYKIKWYRPTTGGGRIKLHFHSVR